MASSTSSEPLVEPASTAFWESDRPHIPDYRLLRLIGRGSFGDVWLAETRGGLWVAVKVLRAEAKDSIELRGLLNYRAYAQGHPNLIQVHHVGEAADRPYYVMELGDSYPCNAPQNPDFYRPRTVRDDLRRRGPYALDTAVEVVEAVLSGLDRLHTEGLLHRDVKPGNILFVRGQPKLGDIGLLAELEEADGRACTPAYAPSEGVLDRAGDLHCLARTLFEMITAHDPMRCPAAPADAPADVRAALERLRPLLARACAGSAADRLTSTERFQETLDQCVKDGRERRIGRYRLLRLLGEGQFGAVYLASQDEPRRSVALKVMKRGVASRSALSRFRYEARTLARLRHPNIAHVYEAGTHDDGLGLVPYFAMEYVEKAKSITAYAASKRLGTRERLELFAKVCDAVHHGHQKGVIHRDLKPENILVDARGEPKIIDFGVARAADTDVATTTLRTGVGELVGTLQYMSPEQCEADPEDLDTRSDVYALGVVMYELLCERRPYEVEGKTIVEAARVIREVQPARLGTVDRRLTGDPETIAGKALEKDRECRYRSAEALGTDVRRYLRDEPIAARPPSMVYQLRKFARRNTMAFRAAVTVLVVLVLATVTTSVISAQLHRVRSELTRSNDELDTKNAALERASADAIERAAQLQQVVEFQQSMLGAVDVEAMGRSVLDELRTRVESSLAEAGLDEAEVAARLEALTQATAGVNATSLALATLDEHVLSRAVETIGDSIADQPRVESALRQAVANTYTELGLLDAAMTQQTMALEIRRREDGDEHPDTLESINGVGYLMKRTGRLDEAEAYYREALAGRRRALGDDHAETVQSLNNLGMLLLARGRTDEAEPILLETLERSRRVLGDDDPMSLCATNNVAQLLEAQGRRPEAETHLRDALDRFRRVLGDDHPDTLCVTGNLGALLQSTGRREEAEPYYRAALDARRRVLGDDHPDTLVAVNNMGFLLQSMGRLSEAEPFYREVLDKSRRVLGAEHLRSLCSASNLGRLLKAMGRFDEAEPYSRAALEGGRRTLGDEHAATLSFLHNLGMLLVAAGQTEEAERCLREAVETRQRLLGDEHRATLASTSGLAELLRARGRFDEAERYHRQALDGRRRVLGETHLNTLVSTYEMAELRRDQGRLDESAALHREVIDTAARTLAPDHWRHGVFRRGYGCTLAALGRYAEAEQALLEAHRILVAALGADHPRVSKAVAVIVDLYDAWEHAAPGDGHGDRAAIWRARLTLPADGRAAVDNGLLSAAHPRGPRKRASSPVSLSGGASSASGRPGVWPGLGSST